MANIEITGTLGRDPELRFTPSGDAVLNFSAADDLRQLNKQTNQWETVSTTWWRVAVWGKPAESLAESLTKGSRVVVLGTVHERKYDKDGEERSSFDVKARTVAVIPRAGSSAPAPSSSRSAGADDPWATPVSRDEPPF